MFLYLIINLLLRGYKMDNQTKKYYFIATKENMLSVYGGEWTIDNTSGSPHESRKIALEEMEYFKGSFPTKLIVVKSHLDINSSKEANEMVMEEVNHKIKVLNI